MLYFWLKLIHILSATILFGTGLGSAFYMFRAHLSSDDRAIAFASRNVVIADWIFTTPAVIIQPITGFALMYVMGYPIVTPWILWSLGLFILTGVCWIPVVWLQIQIHRFAKESISTGISLYKNQTYLRYMRYWFLLGWPAFIAVIIIFYLMVFKPQLALA
jgi:uncharacterized membrane protein